MLTTLNWGGNQVVKHENKSLIQRCTNSTAIILLIKPCRVSTHINWLSLWVQPKLAPCSGFFFAVQSYLLTKIEMMVNGKKKLNEKNALDLLYLYCKL